MEKRQIIIKYDGPALLQHEIDLSALSDSVEGMNILLKDVYTTLNGTSDGYNAKVVGGFQAGSFEYLIEIAQDYKSYADSIKAIGFGAAAGSATLVSVFKWINGRKITRLVFTQEGDCNIHTEDGASMVAPSYMKVLLTSPNIRKALAKVIHAPLAKEGIDEFKVYDGAKQEQFSIGKDASKIFKYQATPIINESTEEPIDDAVITFLTVHTDKSTSWRINYEDERLSVAMKDDEFMNSIRSGSEPKLFTNAYRVKLIRKSTAMKVDSSYVIDAVYGPIS